MTIAEVLKKYSSIEVEPLLSKVLGKSKEFLYLNPETILSSYQINILSRLIKRREAGEPIAYILGYKDFMGLRFKVNKDVLIPRPETEWLVEKIVTSEKLKVASGKIRILDVGTGSGCMAVSLAKQFSNSNSQFSITASDISPAALKAARQNAKANHVQVKFINTNLFRNISGKFDVIVANLPYIPLKILHRYLIHKTELEPSDPFAALKFEPKFALTDGSSSFVIYKRFFDEVRGYLNPSATILLEIDPSSRKFLKEYQKRYLPKAAIKFYKDYNNLWRYAEIKTK